MTEERILDRIRKLLAKAESTTPAEAESLVAKAQELMATHRITQALLNRTNHAEGVTFRRVSMPGGANLVKAKRGLLHVIAEGNSCTTVIFKQAGYCEVIGHESDTELVEVLYTSLVVQMQRAMNIAMREPNPARVNLSVRKNNFCWGFVERLQDRFAQIRYQHEKHEPAVGAYNALVLYDRQVADAVADRYPRLRKDTGKRRQYDPTARAQGAAAADRADMTTGNSGVTGGTRGALNA